MTDNLFLYHIKVAEPRRAEVNPWPGFGKWEE